MAEVPSIKEVIPTLSYSTSFWDDAVDTWDNADFWDGSVAVQSGFSDQILVQVLGVIIILFVLSLNGAILKA